MSYLPGNSGHCPVGRRIARADLHRAVSAFDAMIFTGGTGGDDVDALLSIVGGSRRTATAIVSLLPSAKHGDLGGNRAGRQLDNASPHTTCSGYATAVTPLV